MGIIKYNSDEELIAVSALVLREILDDENVDKLSDHTLSTLILTSTILADWAYNYNIKNNISLENLISNEFYENRQEWLENMLSKMTDGWFNLSTTIIGFALNETMYLVELDKEDKDFLYNDLEQFTRDPQQNKVDIILNNLTLYSTKKHNKPISENLNTELRKYLEFVVQVVEQIKENQHV